MDFTREPIIETVITPKEGWKLVLRSSKGGASEEYFVDAVEVVTFGRSQFYRTLERPKSFLLPVTDYEVLEVREARMVLKNVGVDRNIKIGGGRDAMRAPKEQEERPPQEKAQPQEAQEKGEGRGRGRRRLSRRRRGKDGQEGEQGAPAADQPVEEGAQETPTPRLIAPPTTLISETLSRYREDDTYAGAFYNRDEPATQEEPAMPYVGGDQDFDEGDQLLFGSGKRAKPAPVEEQTEESATEEYFHDESFDEEAIGNGQPNGETEGESH